MQATRWTAARPWVSTACRLVLGVVFVVAGTTKISDVPASGRAVNAYQLMPYSLAKVLGAMLPVVEIVIGLLLIVGLAVRLTAIVAGLLLVVYIIAIASVWARGLAIDCGCFSKGGALAPGQAPSYGPDIARDVGLLALAAFLVVWPMSRLSIDHLIFGPTPHGEANQ
jgi:uncharacterized membrane protein YphA (DoxX/SURF4 family)